MTTAILRHHETERREMKKGWITIVESKQEDDHEVIARFQKGDAAAYDELMLRYQDSVAVHMRRFSSVPEVVEDLTQIVVIRAYRSLDNYEPRAPFISWLRTIANRVGYEHWRTEARRIKCIPLHDRDEFPAADHHAENDLTDDNEKRYNELMKVMDMLKPAERQTLYLMYVDGLSVAETAATMGWNVAMTKMRAYRARKKLRAIVTRQL
ncbi:MAG: RNA polymerase sigma factor [Planctomycetes bacterium]|nr:RNA polymerase sigma factor [Planctomycetota bacterium]